MISRIGIGRGMRTVSFYRPLHTMVPRAGVRSHLSSIRPNIHLISKRTVKTPTIDWTPMKSTTSDIRLKSEQAKTPILRKFFLGLMIAMPVISFFLGCWQVKRLNWKVDLIAKCEDLLAAPPLEKLPPNIDPEVIRDFEFRRFKVKGHFDYSQEMFLGPRMRNSVLGYLVITPFIRSDGGDPILVERGWISKDKVIPETRSKGYLSHLALPQGEVEIHALFRVMPKRSNLQYEHTPGDKLFYIPDVEAMAKQSGSLPIYSQVIYSLKDHPDWKGPEQVNDDKKSVWQKLAGKIKPKSEKSNEVSTLLGNESDDDQTLQYQEFEFIDQGVPVGAVPKVNFTNNHLQYLVTWFGLSFASTGLLIYSFWKNRQFSSADKIIAAKRKDMHKKF